MKSNVCARREQKPSLLGLCRAAANFRASECSRACSYCRAQPKMSRKGAKMQHVQGVQGIPAGPVEQSIFIGLTSREALHVLALYAPTICPFGAGNHSARQAYKIRPVVTVVGITIATLPTQCCLMLFLLSSIIILAHGRRFQNALSCLLSHKKSVNLPLLLTSPYDKPSSHRSRRYGRQSAARVPQISL